MKIHEAIRSGSNILFEHGIHDPDWNAERCLLLALKTDRAELYAHFERELSEQEFETYRKYVLRRAVHYPLAYLEGRQEFFGRDYFVNEDVLIPRPETEEIIHGVLELRSRPIRRIIDFGSGSGCIPITLAFEIPEATVVGLELSRGAIEVIRQNARGRIEIVCADLFAPPIVPAAFDVATANPPYVERHEIADLPAETRWEPQIALITNDLESTYGGVLKSAASVLKAGGTLLFEIGAGQMQRIAKVCEEFAQFEFVQIRKDRHSIPRVFVLRKT